MFELHYILFLAVLHTLLLVSFLTKESSEGNNNTNGKLDSNGRPIAQKRLIDSQLQQCPMINLCSASIFMDPSSYENAQSPIGQPSFGEVENNFCCKNCKCESKCGVHMDCCPDILPMEYFTGIKALPAPEETCIPASLKQVFDRGVYGISSCPNQSSVALSRGCYKVLDKEDYSNLNISELILVTDLLDKRIFKNRYCAMCHGVPENRLVYWDSKLECASVNDSSSLSHNIISDIMNKDIGCNILFYAKSNSSNFDEYCYVVESACNATGLWREYDQFEEWACSTYIAPIQASDKKYYKNIFCMLCNGLQQEETYCAPPSRPGSRDTKTTLSGLLLFKERSSSQKRAVCKPGFIYNIVKGDCIKAECSILRRLEDNHCQSLFTTAEVITYNLHYRILPLSNLTIGKGLEVLEKIKTWINHNVLATFTYLPHSFKRTVVFLITSPDHGRTLSQELLIQYYDVTLSLFYNTIHEPEKVLESHLQTLYSHNFEIVVESEIFLFECRVRDDPGILTFRAEQRLGEGSGGFLCLTLDVKHSTNPFDRIKEYAWYDKRKDSFIVPLMEDIPCEMLDMEKELDTVFELHSVLALRTCPTVRIVYKDMPWNETPDGIIFLHNKMFVRLSDIMYDRRRLDGYINESISLCADTFFTILAGSTFIHSMNTVLSVCLLIVKFTHLQY